MAVELGQVASPMPGEEATPWPPLGFHRLKTYNRVGAISKPHVSTPKSFTFVLKSTMNTKKWYLKVNNHPLIGFLVL